VREKSEALVLYRLEQANESLESAPILLDKEARMSNVETPPELFLALDRNVQEAS